MNNFHTQSARMCLCRRVGLSVRACACTPGASMYVWAAEKQQDWRWGWGGGRSGGVGWKCEGSTVYFNMSSCFQGIYALGKWLMLNRWPWRNWFETCALGQRGISHMCLFTVRRHVAVTWAAAPNFGSRRHVADFACCRLCLRVEHVRLLFLLSEGVVGVP